MNEENHFSDGQVLDTDFEAYPIPIFSWLLHIETVIVPNDDLPPKGGGEQAIICMGGLPATAVHDATGAVPHQLPMTRNASKRCSEAELFPGLHSLQAALAGPWKIQSDDLRQATPPD